MVEGKGVLLCAFGAREYYYMAANLLVSLKHHDPDLPVVLLHDGGAGFLVSERRKFDDEIQLPGELRGGSGKLDPAWVKLHLDKFRPFTETIVLDVDQLALSSVMPIFQERPDDPWVAVSGRAHTLDMGREIPDMHWAYADDLWEHYNLNRDAKLPALNTSAQVLRSGCEAFYEQARKNYLNPIPIELLRRSWGGTQPDELYLNVAAAQLDYWPGASRPWVLTAEQVRDEPLTELRNTYHLLCMYGGNAAIRPMWKEVYDRVLIREYLRPIGLEHIYKWGNLGNAKHAGKTTQLTETVRLNSAGRNRFRAPGVANHVPGSGVGVPVAVRWSPPHPDRADNTVLRVVLPWFKSQDDRRARELELAAGQWKADVRVELLLVSEDVVPVEVAPVSERLQVEKRPTFAELIAILNERVAFDIDRGCQTISVICNADCAPGPELIGQLIRFNWTEKDAICLTRWEADGKAPAAKMEYSQDLWAWYGKINLPAGAGDYHVGVLGCDNVLANELHLAGYRLHNPALEMELIHRHQSNVRTYSEAGRLKQQYKHVPITALYSGEYKRMLLKQPGKVGDIIRCLGIAYHFWKKGFRVDWELPEKYHDLLNEVPWVRPVQMAIPPYDKVLDIGFGLGGEPEGWWRRERGRFASFVEAKYELAGVPIELANKMLFPRNHKREIELLRTLKIGYGEPIRLVHLSSDYGTVPDVSKLEMPWLEGVLFKKLGAPWNKDVFLQKRDQYKTIEYRPIPGHPSWDWLAVIERAAIVECIDSSLCNLVELCHTAPAYQQRIYLRTDRIPNDYDRTLLDWSRWKVADFRNGNEAATLAFNNQYATV